MAKPRPVTTTYDWERCAHSTTVAAAIQSAVKRIVRGDYSVAHIYNAEGKHCVDVYRSRNQLVIHARRRNVF